MSSSPMSSWLPGQRWSSGGCDEVSRLHEAREGVGVPRRGEGHANVRPRLRRPWAGFVAVRQCVSFMPSTGAEQSDTSTVGTAVPDHLLGRHYLEQDQRRVPCRPCVRRALGVTVCTRAGSV
jgi:hypothetical protein